jgi:cytosine/adenosine deaminase-related metal-dependent hydrolase
MKADRLLIRNAHVLALDDADREWPCADIVVQGDRITAVGPDAGTQQERPFDRVIEAEGLIAMPGLINAHFHSPGNLMKGALPGYPLEIFMLHEVPPLASNGDAGRLAYLRTMVGALEMLRRGITAVHDDAYHVPMASVESIDAIMQAYADAGIRATVAIDQPNVVETEKLPWLHELLPPADLQALESAPRQSGAELIALYQHLIDRWHGAAGGRLSAAVSCSAPQRVTVDYFRALSALSKAHDLPFNIHMLETKLQRVLGQQKYGCSLVKYVHGLGLLDARMMVIHAIWVDAEDIALLAQAGCTVAHNPVCNLRLGSGVMPYLALRDAGVPICLGSDEMNTDDSVNLWFVAKTAALLHTLSTPDYTRWPQPPEMLRALTQGGARALRRSHDLGQLAPGCVADIVLLRKDTVAYTPLNDLRRQLVHCEDGASVHSTLVGGRVVFEQGRITTVDEAALRSELHALMRQGPDLQARADASRLEPYYRAMVLRAAAQDVGMNRWLPAFSGA